MTYELGGKKLKCEIRKWGADAGSLKVAFSVGDNITSVQQTSSRSATINFVHGSGGLLSAISSHSWGGGQRQNH